MRVLCPVTGSASHVRAMLPVVRALAEARHDVLVVAPHSLLPLLQQEPVKVVQGLTDIVPEAMRITAPVYQGLSADVDPDEFRTLVSLTLTGGPHVSENFHALLPVARDFRPDIVVRDGYELTGCLVAERIGVPHLALPSGGGQVLDPVRVGALLNERRREAGLPEQDDPLAHHRFGRLDCVPADYSFAHPSLPPAFTYRQPETVGADATAPAWFADLPPDKPLVLAALGGAVVAALEQFGDGVAQTHPVMAHFDPVGSLRAIVTGLSELDCVAVVATGGLPAPDAGPNVRLVDVIPQTLLLQCARLFVTHGGYNSVRESMRAGVPMAVLPQFDDQFPNADRVTASGLGARIDDPSEVAKLCARLLDDASIAAGVRRAQRQAMTLPPVSSVVDHLVEVVASHR